MATKLYAPAPDISCTRSVLADWLELEALATEREEGVLIRPSLSGVFDIVEDPALNQIEREYLPEEYSANEMNEEAIDGAFEELAYRDRHLGDAYPFEIDFNRGNISFRKIKESNYVILPYLFCLLSCAIRDGRLQGESVQEGNIGDLFQACACLAASRYLGGQVISFGFPRQEGTGFWDALRLAYTAFGSGKVHESPPVGVPKRLKDAGIDIIAWKDHPDKLPAKLYLLGQCASGRNWKEKSVLEFLGTFHSYFSQRPAQHVTPAIFTPFPLQHDFAEKGIAFEDWIKGAFWHTEVRYGIVFDRMRLAHYAGLYLAKDSAEYATQAIERRHELTQWVEAHLCALIQGRGGRG